MFDVIGLGRRAEQWLHAPAPAERLAGLRIAIGGFVVAYLALNATEVARLADQSPRQFEPIGVARVLDAPLPSVVLWAMFAAALVLGIGFTAGLWVRIAGPAFALLVLGWTSYHSSWGQLLHFEHLFTIHLLILGFAPVGDAWAPGTQARRPPGPRYGWPIRLLALATALAYLLSGITKLQLSGTEWFDPDTLANHIGYSATRMQSIGGPTPPLARLVLENAWLMTPMAVGSLFVELGAPLALLNTRLRNMWVASAVLFHLGTAATMFVFFGYRGFGFAFLPLFAIERAVQRVRWGSGGRSPAATA